MSENISDALKMGAALLLFVLAMSVAIYAFSKARYSSEKAMQNLDGTFLFYDTDNIYLDVINPGTGKNTIKIDIQQQAIVDKSQFLINLFNYYKSGYTLLFYYLEPGDLVVDDKERDGTIIKIKAGKTIKKLPLYYSEANDRYLNRSILRVNPTNFILKTDGSAAEASVNSNDSSYRAIYGLDISDEIVRQEPWIINDAYINKFVEDLVMAYVDAKALNITGTKASSYTTSTKSKMTNNIFKATSDGQAYEYWFKYKYTEYTDNKGFMNLDCRFIQRIGTYNYESSSNIHTYSQMSDEDKEALYQEYDYDNLITTIDASQDLLTNGELIDNYSGTEKKIVQYIYIGEANEIYNK